MKKLTLLLLILICIGAFNVNAQTTLILQPNAANGKDASVQLWGSDSLSNSGNDENFICNAWTSGGDYLNERSLIEFLNIPQNITINSAKLYLYCNTTSGHTQRQSWFPGSFWNINDAHLLRVTSPWQENTVNWSNQPSTDTLHQVTIPPSTSNVQDYVIDVTQLLQYMNNNPSTSYGFEIKLDDESIYRSLIFASSDHPDSSKRPKLVINYKAKDDNSIIGNNTSMNKLNFFPNPNNGLLNIDINNVVFHLATFQIFDCIGQLVKAISINYDSHIQLNLLDLNKGVYIIKTKIDGNDFQINKLIIN